MPSYRWLRPLLFQLPPETAHRAALWALRHGLVPELRPPSDPRLAVALGRLRFPHPIGLAAGMDKDGEAIAGFARLGFSHLEVGTVTARPQPGNPRPRCFRLPEDGALLNRFGFNNHGAAALAARLAALPQRPCVIGVNLGKSKVVEAARAVDDYAAALAAIGPLADYLVINVSSPNTPGLRDLQEERALHRLLAGLQGVRAQAAPGVPCWLKIAPDLADAAIDAIVDAALTHGIDGLVCTNTTVQRPALRSDAQRVRELGAGGLSGSPLAERSTAVLARVARRLAGARPLIGVGGVDHPEIAWRKITHGASLVQVYTGLVMRGPGLVCELVAGLSERLRLHGLPSIAAAVGRDL
ncbi:MAG: quinone-dependent dihydroorotate dehydrogenase [Planctomycetota bacterium]|nr:quinone-dependent dihydroorotate dehydrogenase [Planctomycetota bacterium]MCX8040227.1 quinone-dependent dihydroorotate dehydrogenase [Planctomycetota bacterium]MDW8372478.1 quinone-dependent dihydroorotate dehydrogenase [Planctomycetota bacterium]